MPWWGRALVGWAGLSLVLGPLIGRWLKSVTLTEDKRVWLASGEQTSRLEARRAVQLFNEHVHGCPICDGLENVLCDEGERLNEEANTASALDAAGAWRDQRLGDVIKPLAPSIELEGNRLSLTHSKDVIEALGG